MSEKCDRGHYNVSLPRKRCCKIHRFETIYRSITVLTDLLQPNTAQMNKKGPGNYL